MRRKDMSVRGQRRVATRGSTIPRMSRFRVDFLGCKVSHVDAHELRERLLRDGHDEAPAGTPEG